jgi:urease accessory protein
MIGAGLSAASQSTHCPPAAFDFMKKRTSLIPIALVTGALLSPSSLQAHHAEFMAGNPFLQGVSMPAHGIDHLLSALSVGLIASRSPQNLRDKLLALFALVALLGGFVNLGGISLPELAVPMTVLLSGILLWKQAPGTIVAGLLVAATGLVNGQALIENAPVTLPTVTFAAGCIASACALYGTGFLLGTILQQRQTLNRAAGGLLIAAATIVALFPSINAAVIHFVE